MDISYILHNTIVYGIIAFVLARILSHNKYLSFAIGWVLIWVSYVFQSVFTWWLGLAHFLHLLFIFIVLYWLDTFIYKSFQHEYVRDLFGLIFTMWFTIFVTNLLFFIYGPSAISIDIARIPNIILITLLIFLQVIIYFLYRHTIFWKITWWMHENSRVVETLSIRRNPINLWNTLFSFFLICVASYVILSSSSLGSWDEIFYVIKWIWIFIIVWIHRLEYMFIWALAYVILEHILFINLWFPLEYKESMILFIILGILIWKPQWVFSLKTRKI